MASESSKSFATLLLILNIALYFVITVIAASAMNHSIERSYELAFKSHIPARLFPMYFPDGNMATGFFIIISLLAGVVGMTTSVTGFHNVNQWDSSNIYAAAASSATTLSLTLLSLGFACKEIDLGWTGSNLRTLEIVTIVASATQLFCTGAIYSGVGEVLEWERKHLGRGRV